MRVWKPPRAPARRSLKRSRGTGPRATVPRTPPFTVGRGPVPRHAPISGETLSDARMETFEDPHAPGPKTIARDRPPRYGIQHAPPLYRRARACPSPCCVNRKIAGDRPSRYRPGRKNARETGPRATVIEKSRGTGPRATFISFSSPHQTSSASDSPQKQDPATAASLMFPVSHQTRLLRSGSSIQYPTSRTCR